MSIRFEIFDDRRKTKRLKNRLRKGHRRFIGITRDPRQGAFYCHWDDGYGFFTYLEMSENRYSPRKLADTALVRLWGLMENKQQEYRA